jgi:AraC-like DNA-binding protein
MIYQYITPRLELQEFVRDYLIVHLLFDKNESIPYKPFPPKPEQGLLFTPLGSITLQSPITGSSFTAPAASVFGQQVQKFNFHVSQEYLMIKVHFKPGALYRVLEVALSEIIENCVEAEPLVGMEVRQINERLANETLYPVMIQIVEQYLLDKVRNVNKGMHPIDKATSYMLTNPTSFSLEWLASEACLSPRQFDRKFIERIGISPKLYSRIVRFNHAYQYKVTNPAANWLTIAINSGYSDYQHLVKDFKEFSNLTPPLFLEEHDMSPEIILRLM